MFWQEEKQIFHKTSPTSAWKMASSKNKGQAPIQGYSQEERLTMRQYFKRHEGTSFGLEPRRATSLQSFAPTKVTYSNGTKAITLQEVLSKTLQFSNGVYTESSLITFTEPILEVVTTFSKEPSKH